MFRNFMIVFLVFSCLFSKAQTKSKFDNLFDSANKYEDRDWSLSFYYAKMAMENQTKATSYEDIISLNVIYDNHYEKLNMLDSSFAVTKRSLRLATEHNDTTLIAYSHINMANIYVAAGNYESAIQMFKKALTSLIKKNDVLQIANTYYNLTMPYSEMNMWDSVSYYVAQASVNYRKINDYSGLALCYDVYGTEADRNGNYKDAVKFYELEIQSFKLANEDANLIIPYQNIADTYLKWKDYVNCKKYLDLGMDLAVSLGSKSDIYEISLIYSKYYEAIGDYKQANFYMKRYYQGKDTIVNTQLKIEMSDQKSEFDRENAKALFTIQKLEAEKQLKSKQAITWGLILSSVFFIIVLVLSVNRYRSKQKSYVELNEYKNQLIIQKEKVELTQKEIIDSINYAKRIQNTVLANQNFIDSFIKESFILFKPKDIVSGDFYWATQKDNYFYLAVCDSTGHGVPGAFISLLNVAFLSEAINEKNITEPNLVFNYVRVRLMGSVSKEGQSDGFDGTLLRLNCMTGELVYAAANSGPVLISDGKMLELPKDKMPVGQYEKMSSFNLYTIDHHKKDLLYFYTDGFADQFGGPKGKKFKRNQLNQNIMAIHQLPMDEQEEHLNKLFTQWRGNLEQVDDVCIMGIRI
ncbi:MAG: SpoIIE family protein phosphatase [Bacteroidota bacterium]